MAHGAALLDLARCTCGATVAEGSLWKPCWSTLPIAATSNLRAAPARPIPAAPLSSSVLQHRRCARRLYGTLLSHALHMRNTGQNDSYGDNRAAPSNLRH